MSYFAMETDVGQEMDADGCGSDKTIPRSSRPHNGSCFVRRASFGHLLESVSDGNN
jgi:hypothetical protein